jgi:hypothetical protein
MPPECQLTEGCTLDHGHPGCCHVPEPMPETTEQVEGGSPKVAEAAREAGFAAIMDAHYSCRQTNAGIAWSLVDRILNAATPYLFSALLSDEAIEGYARETWGWDGSRPLTDDEKSAARASISAAIDHLGGTDAH